MVAQNVVFGVIAAAMAIAALRVVTTKNIVHAALYLMVVLAGVAALYILLAAEFTAVVQVLVYIGAILVLFLFGIMLTRAPIGRMTRLSSDNWYLGAFVAALLGALFIQVGTNLSNDYSDARRGADTEDRLGPVRVTAGGLLPPRSVLIGTYVAFGIAVAAGLYLALVAGWELLLVGVASIAAGVLYTGGPRPYGYEGLGELFVFLFFGVVAVVGSYYVQVEELSWEAFALSVPVGLLAAGILVVNNVRDVDTDRRAGKRTLAVKLGPGRARSLFLIMLAIAYVAPVAIPLGGGLSWWTALPLISLPLAVPLWQTVRTRSDGPSLNNALAGTGRLLAAFSLLLSAGILLS